MSLQCKERISKEVYKQLENEILTKINFEGSTPRYFSFQEYFEKMDLIIVKPFEEILQILDNPEIISLEYNHITINYPFQDFYFKINLIKTSSMKYNCCKFFFSFEGLSEIINEIFKRYCFSFTEEGLFLDNESRPLVTADPIEIIKTMGLDYSFYDYYRGVGEYDVNINTIFDNLSQSCIFDSDNWNIRSDCNSLYNIFTREYISKLQSGIKSEKSNNKKVFTEAVLKRYEVEIPVYNKIDLKDVQKVSGLSGEELFDFLDFVYDNSSLKLDTDLQRTKEEINNEIKSLVKKFETSQFDLLV